MQCFLAFYIKMHDSIEPIKFVVQTTSIPNTVIFMAKRIVFFQFPDNYNLFHIFYYRFGLVSDCLLWRRRPVGPKNVNLEAHTMRDIKLV
jgi:hypothetical protein